MTRDHDERTRGMITKTLTKHHLVNGMTLTLAVSLISLAGIKTASACSCRQPGPPKAIFKAAHVIFEGVAVKVELSDIKENAQQRSYQGAKVTSTFELIKGYKGEPGKTIKVNSRLGSSLCGWQPVRLGQSLLIIAHKTQDGSLSTNACTMCGASDALREWLKEVGK